MATTTTPVPKGPQKRPMPVDFELLTAEDKLKIHEAALKKAREIKLDDAKKAYEKIALEEALREEGLEEEQVTFKLELAEFANKIVIDGRSFFHGFTYTVGMGQFRLISEMAYRTRLHQLEIDGKSRYKWQGWSDPRVGVDHRATIHGSINTTGNMQRV